jgi:hypothetical protein
MRSSPSSTTICVSRPYWPRSRALRMATSSRRLLPRRAHRDNKGTMARMSNQAACLSATTEPSFRHVMVLFEVRGYHANISPDLRSRDFAGGCLEPTVSASAERVSCKRGRHAGRHAAPALDQRQLELTFERLLGGNVVHLRIPARATCRTSVYSAQGCNVGIHIIMSSIRCALALVAQGICELFKHSMAPRDRRRAMSAVSRDDLVITSPADKRSINRNFLSGIATQVGKQPRPRDQTIRDEFRTVAGGYICEKLDGKPFAIMHFDGATNSQITRVQHGDDWNQRGWRQAFVNMKSLKLSYPDASR